MMQFSKSIYTALASLLALTLLARPGAGNAQSVSKTPVPPHKLDVIELSNVKGLRMVARVNDAKSAEHLFERKLMLFTRGRYLEIADFPSLNELKSVRLPGVAFDVRLSIDKTKAYVAHEGGLAVIDTDSWSIIDSYEQKTGFEGIAFSPDKKFLIALGKADIDLSGPLVIFDLATLTPLLSVPASRKKLELRIDHHRNAVFSKDGKTVALISPAGIVRLVSLEHRRLTRTLQLGGCCTFAENGPGPDDFVVAAGKDQRLIDSQGRTKSRVTGLTRRVLGPDGLSVGDDNVNLVVLDSSGIVLKKIPRQDSTLLLARWTDDHRLLLTFENEFARGTRNVVVWAAN
jgi:hypothetical protein